MYYMLKPYVGIVTKELYEVLSTNNMLCSEFKISM